MNVELSAYTKTVQVKYMYILAHTHTHTRERTGTHTDSVYTQKSSVNSLNRKSTVGMTIPWGGPELIHPGFVVISI